LRRLADSPASNHASHLTAEIIRLGPWHLDVQVTPEISTRVFLDAPEGTYPSSGPLDPASVSFISPRERWQRLMKLIYPEGLGDRSLLDCACNCGGYSFWAKELDAVRCFGFDVREHWIQQARFLAKHRPWPSEGVEFHVLNLYDLPQLSLQPFDITLFKGIFYHLPDPITGMKIACDLTKDVIILDTAIRTDLPDGMLAVAAESPDIVMSGVYGLNWFPTGPAVLVRTLRWLGFTEARVVEWVKEPEQGPRPVGRVQIVAARESGRLERISSVGGPRDFPSTG
jgi:tRNA (mo5U34)-methyltransferase